MLGPLSVAIVGLGEVAVRRHLPVLANHPDFRIVSAAELDTSRAERIARDFSIPLVSADALALMRSEQVDVVAILTPPTTHAALVHQALDAGKHVFVEKPLTLDVGEAHDLAAHAERAQTKLLVGFNQRHHVQLERARAMLRAGALGPLRAGTTFIGNTYRRVSMSPWHADPGQGDILYEVGVHHFDALRYLLDAEVVEVLAQEAITPNDTATKIVQLRWTNGLLTTTTLVEDSIEKNSIELVGERGKLDLALYTFDGLAFLPRGTYEGSIGVRVSQTRDTLSALVSALPRIRRGGDYNLTYRAEWDHLSDIIRNNLPPLAGARDGLEATRIAVAGRESITNHAPVYLPINPP